MTPAPPPSRAPLLADRFAAQATARPAALAVVGAGGCATYGELHARAEEVARGLAAHPRAAAAEGCAAGAATADAAAPADGPAAAGADAPARVALLARADVDSLATTLAAMRLGVSVVVLDRHLTARQLERVLDGARPGLLIASGRLPRPAVERLPDALRTTPEALAAAGAAARATGAGEGQDGAGAAPLRRAAPADELLVGLTSGTSGEPKLFARDQASWGATLDRSDAAFDVRPGDRVSIPGPLDHSHFFYGALHALTRGAAVDLRPLEQAFAPAEQPTHVYLVPTLAVDLVAALGGAPRPSVRAVVSSAAAWPEHARARLARLLPQAEIAHFYGASELSFVALDSSREQPPPGSAGRAFPGVEIEVRDAAGRALSDGEQGVVHVRSDMLFAGYLTDAGHAGGPDGDGWATVGDLGTLRDGWLEIAGRASDTIVYGGLNVEPGAVERALGELESVAEAACVGLPDERWGAVPVAALVLEPGAAPPRRADVRAHARATLPQPSRPRQLFLVDALPRNARGKLLRGELVRRIGAGEAAELG